MEASAEGAAAPDGAFTHTSCIDAIQAWYLLSTLARCTSVHLDGDAADGSLRADGWPTLGECLGIIPWVARAAGEAPLLLACLSRAPGIRCIF